jgi:diaminohydroxyphosphoribosylaminopyrimidine deaminase/5-amino-6-(5-phosphoribosylamino)uracil reductase
VRDAGLRRVVAAMRDPNPLVNGRGLALLRRAGVASSAGVLEDEAVLLNERFLVSSSEGRPFVLLKAALTLDGRIATATGDSKWITSPAQRAQARWLRRLHDAVLVGIGTALADDPLLLPSPRTRRPFTRIVIDSRLRLPPASRLARSSRPGTPVLVITSSRDARARRRLERAGVEVLPIRAGKGRIPPGAALRALAARGLRSVMVEGGSEMLGSFLAARLVDQVALFRAPLLLGGRGGRSAFGGADPRKVADALRLEPTSPRVRRGSGARFPWPRPRLFELWYPRR